MAKVRDQHIYSSNVEELKRLAEDYSFVGRRVQLSIPQGRLTVFALPATWKRKEQEERRLQAIREDRYGGEL